MTEEAPTIEDVEAAIEAVERSVNLLDEERQHLLAGLVTQHAIRTLDAALESGENATTALAAVASMLHLVGLSQLSTHHAHEDWTRESDTQVTRVWKDYVQAVSLATKIPSTEIPATKTPTDVEAPTATDAAGHAYGGQYL